MGQITSALLDSTFKGFNTIFTRGKMAAQAQSFWSQIAMQTTSTGEDETYAELEKIPRMREWIGDREFHNLVANAQKLVNRDFEDSFEVDRNKIEDDKLGIFSPSIEMLGMQVGKLPDDLVVAALLAGTTTTTADGQYFFDTDHPVKPSDPLSATQRNYYSSGKALTAANYELVRAEMMGLLGEDGKPLGIVPNLLVVPPALDATAKRIVMADKDASGATNINQGTARHLMIPDLAAYSTAWYLMDTRFPIKPLIYQERRAAEFQAYTNSRDAEVFKRKKYQYGADARGAAGYGWWALAFKAVA